MLVEGRDEIPPAPEVRKDSTDLSTVRGEERNYALLKHYLLTGSIVETARTFGETAYGLSQLMASDWWRREYEFLRREQLAQENVKLTELWNSTLAQIEHVLKYGEEVQDKQGNLIQKSLSANSLARLAEVLFDKRQIVRNAPTHIVQEQAASKLEELADKLTRLGRLRTIEHSGSVKNDPSSIQTED